MLKLTTNPNYSAFEIQDKEPKLLPAPASTTLEAVFRTFSKAMAGSGGKKSALSDIIEGCYPVTPCLNTDLLKSGAAKRRKGQTFCSLPLQIQPGPPGSEGCTGNGSFWAGRLSLGRQCVSG